MRDEVRDRCSLPGEHDYPDASFTCDTDDYYEIYEREKKV